MSPTTPRVDPLSYLADDLEQLKAQGLYRRLRVLEDEQRAHTTFDGRSVVNLSSNNYLGLTTHPKLRERALEAIERFGVGIGLGAHDRRHDGDPHGARAPARRVQADRGRRRVPERLHGERRHGRRPILTKEDVIISDELNHASIIDGCRLSRAAIKVFPHKDVDAARKILRELPAGQRKLLITDGVFSMDGDLGPLPELCAARRGIRLHHDGGRRARERRVRQERPRHGRSLRHARPRRHPGRHAVEGDRRARRLRRRQHARSSSSCYHRARPFLFSTSHPPSVAATCLAAIDVLIEEPQIIDRLWENTRFFKAGLAAARLQHRHQREPDYAGDRRRRRARDEAVGSAVRGRRVRAGHRVPDRRPRQGARAHDRHRDAHAGRSAVRARHVRPRRAGAGDRASGAPGPSMAKVKAPEPPKPANRSRGETRGRRPMPVAASGSSSRPTPAICAPTTSSASSRARRPRPGSSSPGRSRPRSWRSLPWHIRAAEYTRRAFLAFTLRLSPARRAIYGIGAA